VRKGRRHAERIALLFDRGGQAELARWWRVAHTDAGEYLLGAARYEGRISDFAERVKKILDALEKSGAWEETYEWRIGTSGTDRVNRLDRNRFAASATHHGTFTVEVPSFAVALEAVAVLGSIQKDLFYAVGWSSWAAPGRMDPADPERKREWPANNVYLERIARAAISETVKTLPEVERVRLERGSRSDYVEIEDRTIRRRFAGANRDRELIVEVTVESGALITTCDAPTAERALEFGGIFARLHRDIPAILGWG
jgi:hypothetical protein